MTIDKSQIKNHYQPFKQAGLLKIPRTGMPFVGIGSAAVKMTTEDVWAPSRSQSMVTAALPAYGSFLVKIKNPSSVNKSNEQSEQARNGVFDRERFEKGDLGKKLGFGCTADVYELKNDSLYVLKVLRPSYYTHQHGPDRETELFKLVHGAKSAKLVDAVNEKGEAVKAILMTKFNGINLNEMTTETKPSDLEQLVFDCLEDLHARGIGQSDLHFGNFMYLPEEHTVKAIDISFKPGCESAIYLLRSKSELSEKIAKIS